MESIDSDVRATAVDGLARIRAKDLAAPTLAEALGRADA